MTCRELSEVLMQYLDGDLTGARRVAFEEHLAECDDCVTYLSGYRAAIELARTSGRDDTPLANEIPEELVRAIVAARASLRKS